MIRLTAYGQACIDATIDAVARRLGCTQPAIPATFRSHGQPDDRGTATEGTTGMTSEVIRTISLHDLNSHSGTIRGWLVANRINPHTLAWQPLTIERAGDRTLIRYHERLPGQTTGEPQTVTRTVTQVSELPTFPDGG